MGVFGATPVAPEPGRTVTTLGRVVEGRVSAVKELLKFASGLPSRSVTPFVAITLIRAPEGKLPVKVTVRESLERETLVLMGVEPLKRRKLFVVTVEGFSGLEKVSTTGVFWPTVVALLGGVTEVTTGLVVSVPVVVVNVALVALI